MLQLFRLTPPSYNFTYVQHGYRKWNQQTTIYLANHQITVCLVKEYRQLLSN
jgi:hypothetical protein